MGLKFSYLTPFLKGCPAFEGVFFWFHGPYEVFHPSVDESWISHLPHHCITCFSPQKSFFFLPLQPFCANLFSFSPPPLTAEIVLSDPQRTHFSFFRLLLLFPYTFDYELILKLVNASNSYQEEFSPIRPFLQTFLISPWMDDAVSPREVFFRHLSNANPESFSLR